MTRYLSLAEFWFLSELVTGIDAATLTKASRVDLADSALHAPQAGFDDTDFYPDVYDKAAVLACRIAWNHPLPDGNKRAAWACLVLFIDLNEGSWNDAQPDTDEAVEAMLDVAARDVDETSQARTLRSAHEYRRDERRDHSITPARSPRGCGAAQVTRRIVSRYDIRHVDIYRSARKHGVADADILHAVDHALGAAEQDDGKVLYLGADRAGNMLEVVSVTRDDDTEIVIHAMRMRRIYEPLLREMRGTND